MSPEALEVLFGDKPRRPFGLQTKTEIAEVQVYLYKISAVGARDAIQEAQALFDAREVSINERHAIASCVKLLFEDLTRQIGTAGAEAKSGTPVVRRWVTLEILDDPILNAELTTRYSRLMMECGFSTQQSQDLRQALETAFTYELLASGSLPRLSAAR